MTRKKMKTIEAVITVEHARKLIVFAQVQAEERTRLALTQTVLPIIEREWLGNPVVAALLKTEVEHASTDEVLRVFDNAVVAR